MLVSQRDGRPGAVGAGGRLVRSLDGGWLLDAGPAPPASERRRDR